MAKEETGLVTDFDKKVVEWKKEHGDIIEVTVGDKVGYFHNPDWKTWKQAFSALRRGLDNVFVEVIIKNCQLDGDCFDSDDEYFSLKEQFVEVIDFADVKKEKWGDGGFDVILSDKEGKEVRFRLRKLTRELLNRVERAASGNAITKWERLVKHLLVQGKDHPEYAEKICYWYFPLVEIAEDLYDKKEVTIKKL